MTIAELSAERVLSVGALLGEGPVWDARDSTLVFVDIDGALVHRYDPSSGRDETFSTAEPVGAVGLRADGGLVLALATGFALSDRAGDGLERVAGFAPPSASVRFNDGEVDPWGRFLAGTMDRAQREPAGSLYRLDPTGAVETLVGGVTISNGLAFSEDRRTLYYVDTPTGQVDAFDVDPDSGEISGRRRAFPVAPEHGMPDGIALDTDGCCWVACYWGSRVCRFTPDGTLDSIVRLPVSCVTSVAFGGPGLRELYVTTAKVDLDERARAAEPDAGDLFVVSTGAAGFEPSRFGTAAS